MISWGQISLSWPHRVFTFSLFPLLDLNSFPAWFFASLQSLFLWLALRATCSFWHFYDYDVPLRQWPGVCMHPKFVMLDWGRSHLTKRPAIKLLEAPSNLNVTIFVCLEVVSWYLRWRVSKRSWNMNAVFKHSVIGVSACLAKQEMTGFWAFIYLGKPNVTTCQTFSFILCTPVSNEDSNIYSFNNHFNDFESCSNKPHYNSGDLSLNILVRLNLQNTIFICATFFGYFEATYTM